MYTLTATCKYKLTATCKCDEFSANNVMFFLFTLSKFDDDDDVLVF